MRSGKPVSNAKVIAYAWPRDSVLRKTPIGTKVRLWPIGKSTTGASGRFRIAAAPTSIPARYRSGHRTDVTLIATSGTKQLTWNYTSALSSAPTGAARWAEAAHPRATSDIKMDLASGAVYDTANPPSSWRTVNDRVAPRAVQMAAVTGAVTRLSKGVARQLATPLTTLRRSVAMPATSAAGSCISIPIAFAGARNERFQSIYNWKGAPATAVQSYGVYHSLGIAFKANVKDATFRAQGSKDMSLGSSASQSGLVDKNLYNKINYRDYDVACDGFIIGMERRPYTVNALLTKFTPSVKQTWHQACVNYGPGFTATKKKGEAYTKIGGIDLGPISVNAQSGYNHDSEVIYHVKKKSKICTNSVLGWVTARAIIIYKR